LGAYLGTVFDGACACGGELSHAETAMTEKMPAPNQALLRYEAALNITFTVPDIAL